MLNKKFYTKITLMIRPLGDLDHLEI